MTNQDMPKPSSKKCRSNLVLFLGLDRCSSVHYVHDPLAEQYKEMPVSQFLNEMRSAADRGLYEKSTRRK
jgi:hypothetical protein